MNVDQSIKILRKQIKKLENDDFDLEAWKSSTKSILARLFGGQDPKIEVINSLRIDYGSWALRDASSAYDPVKSCKEVGKEVLESSIDELEAFGLEPGRSPSFVVEAMENNLKGSQLKKVREVIENQEGEVGDSFRKNLKEVFAEFDPETNAETLADIFILGNIRQL